MLLIIMSVCLCVSCPLEYLKKRKSEFSEPVTCAVALSLSNDNAINYVLPVLYMTHPCFHIMERMGKTLRQRGWMHRGRRLPSPTASCYPKCNEFVRKRLRLTILLLIYAFTENGFFLTKQQSKSRRTDFISFDISSVKSNRCLK